MGGRSIGSFEHDRPASQLIQDGARASVVSVQAQMVGPQGIDGHKNDISAAVKGGPPRSRRRRHGRVGCHRVLVGGALSAWSR
jgi:hypothetical protein